MGFVEKKQLKWIILIFIILVFYSHGFNMLGWDIFVPSPYYLVASLILIMLALMSYKVAKKNGKANIEYASFLCFWPFVSLLWATLSWGANIYHEGRNVLDWTLLSSFFFIFSKYKVKETTIIGGLTLFAIVTAMIQIYEQIHPENAIFGIINPDNIDEGGDIAAVRNNLYCLKVGSYLLQMFCYFYWWQKLLRRLNLVNIVMVLLLVVSIYLYLTRQILISVIAVSAFSIILSKGRNTVIISTFIIITAAVLLFYYWDILFGNLIKDYSNDSYSTDIRFEFISYIVQYYIMHPLDTLLGQLHSPIEFIWRESKRYFISDIGFIGVIFYFGFFWLYRYFNYIYRTIRYFRKKIPSYLLLYILGCSVVCLFVFSYTTAVNMFVWICLLYISSLYIDERYELTERNDI